MHIDGYLSEPFTRRGRIRIQMISFTLPQPAHVRAALYDPVGGLVETVADGTYDAGFHTLTWNGRNNAGKRAPSGRYLCRLEIAQQDAVRRIIMTPHAVASGYGDR